MLLQHNSSAPPTAVRPNNTQSATIKYIRSITEEIAEQPSHYTYINHSQNKQTQHSQYKQIAEIIRQVHKIQKLMASPKITKQRRKAFSSHKWPYQQLHLPKHRQQPITTSQYQSVKLSINRQPMQKERTKQKKNRSVHSRSLETPLLSKQQAHLSTLLKIKEETKLVQQMHHKSRDSQLTPQQKEQAWADFLLRERRWQQNKKIRQMHQQIIHNIVIPQKDNIISSHKASPGRIASPQRELDRDELIRRVKRERRKVEQQLSKLQPSPTTTKTGQKGHSKLNRWNGSTDRQRENSSGRRVSMGRQQGRKGDVGVRIDVSQLSFLVSKH